MTLISNLRIIMAERKIDTIKELSKKTGVSVKPLYILYKGDDIKSIKLGTLLKICNSLNCCFDELIKCVSSKDNNEFNPILTDELKREVTKFVKQLLKT